MKNFAELVREVVLQEHTGDRPKKNFEFGFGATETSGGSFEVVPYWFTRKPWGFLPWQEIFNSAREFEEFLGDKYKFARATQTKTFRSKEAALAAARRRAQALGGSFWGLVHDEEVKFGSSLTGHWFGMIK